MSDRPETARESHISDRHLLRRQHDSIGSARSQRCFVCNGGLGTGVSTATMGDSRMELPWLVSLRPSPLVCPPARTVAIGTCGRAWSQYMAHRGDVSILVNGTLAKPLVMVQGCARARPCWYRPPTLPTGEWRIRVANYLKSRGRYPHSFHTWYWPWNACCDSQTA